MPDTLGIILALHCHKRKRIQPSSDHVRPCTSTTSDNSANPAHTQVNSPCCFRGNLYILFQMAATWQAERPFPVICQEKQRIAKSHNSDH